MYSFENNISVFFNIKPNAIFMHNELLQTIKEMLSYIDFFFALYSNR